MSGPVVTAADRDGAEALVQAWLGVAVVINPVSLDLVDRIATALAAVRAEVVQARAERDTMAEDEHALARELDIAARHAVIQGETIAALQARVTALEGALRVQRDRLMRPDGIMPTPGNSWRYVIDFVDEEGYRAFLCNDALLAPGAGGTND